MNYLKSKALEYEYKANIFLAIIVLSSFFLGKFLPLNNPWLYTPLLFIWLIFVVILQYLSQRAEKKQGDYLKGYNGENFLEDILKKLPNNYLYVKSIKLKYSNLDFLVISDNGIFGIENKNQNGKITYNSADKQLSRNYYPFRSNYIKQVRGCCLEINRIIKNKLNIDYFIVPVLVFSGLGVSIETPPKIDGTDILSSEMLSNFLIKKRDFSLDKMHQDNIYKLFSDLNKK